MLIRSLISTIGILLLLLYIGNTVMVDSSKQMINFFPERSDEVLLNPYMGLSAYAQDFNAAQPVSLVHVNMYWRELEPEKGVYTFEQLEQDAHFTEWKSIGAKFVIRLILDTPRPEERLDIPDWLYEEIDQDGSWYDIRYGKGFSPNYNNPVLIENHQKLIQAIAAHYNDDPAIAFIQLGSIGHWGEWHTFDGDEGRIPFPMQAITDQYAEHYIAAFTNKPLLMRRPHQIALDHQMGLFNDSFGDYKSTVEEFMDWVNNGYTSWLTKEDMPAMPDFWMYAPSGGEFSPVNREHAYYNDDEIEATLDMIRMTHMSWIGPYAPTDYPLNGPHQANINAIMKTLGYRLSVAAVRHEENLQAGETLHVKIGWRNDGVAPFYFDWPVELHITNSDNRIVLTELLETDIRDWLPGEHIERYSITLPAGLTPGEHTISIAILDPSTDTPGILLAMEGRGSDGSYEISQFNIHQ